MHKHPEKCGKAFATGTIAVNKRSRDGSASFFLPCIRTRVSLSQRPTEIFCETFENPLDTSQDRSGSDAVSPTRHPSPFYRHEAFATRAAAIVKYPAFEKVDSYIIVDEKHGSTLKDFREVTMLPGEYLFNGRLARALTRKQRVSIGEWTIGVY